jgi:hypothetical protein
MGEHRAVGLASSEVVRPVGRSRHQQTKRADDHHVRDDGGPPLPILTDRDEPIAQRRADVVCLGRFWIEIDYRLATLWTAPLLRRNLPVRPRMR